MAWWSWLIIWTVLVLGLLGMLAWLGYRLFVKGRDVLRELDALSRKVGALAENAEKLAPEEPTERAIALGYAETARRHEEHEARRAELKQARREARLARGKLLINPPTIPTLRKRTTNAR
ncbi:hypothetical protein N1031_16150 [Herbiconiux moechotypicola]|uniref:Uncharacterized protein n=1 Tax=Herbiconiux moechotypicola TaxID=637393 RepID=A0ABN3E0Y6_9MICO|nr:hypothetical protein [Herbiconiux moechotypicola]MCS5731297.1 hypothetical protein [Herbiconiux moechotypicola]